MSCKNGDRILLIINPIAGKTHGKSSLYRAADLFEEYGYEVNLKKTEYKGHAIELVQEHSDGHHLIVCCGGDGTLNEVVTGMMKKGVRLPLGYIPAGTTNDFANTLKLSYNLERAVETIMTGHRRTIDVGRFMNKRYFNYIASFGAFTYASYSTPQANKNTIGHLAYILEGVKDIPNIRPYHIRVEADGVVYEDEYIFGAVTNALSIGGMVKLATAQVDLNDGLFEIILVKNPKTAVDLSRIIRAITMKDYNDKMLEFIKASEVTFKMETQIPWSIDGEYEPGAMEVQIHNLKDAVSIFA